MNNLVLALFYLTQQFRHYSTWNERHTQQTELGKQFYSQHPAKTHHYTLT